MTNDPSGPSRKMVADAIDAYDQEIAVLQEGKRETFSSYRDFLKQQGLPPDQISAEVSALKAAIRRRRDVREDSVRVEEREGRVQEILEEITASLATRVARGAREDQSSGSRQRSSPRERSEGDEADAGADAGLVLRPTEAGEPGSEEVIPPFLPRRGEE